MVGLAAPMAVLIAVVMAFGALTSSSEMTVIRASGISLYRLMMPVIVVSLLLSLLVERFNNVVLPAANYYGKSLMVDIARAKPAFGLTENAFSSLVDGYSILVRNSDAKSKVISGVVIYDQNSREYSSMVTAEKGTIDFSPDYQYLVMTLVNGEIHQIQQPEHLKYRIMSFKKHRFVFESSGFGFERSSANRMRSGDSELSARELLTIGREFQQRIALSEQHIRQPLELMASRIRESGTEERKSLSSSSLSQEQKRASLVAGYLDRQLGQLDRELKNIESNRTMYNSYMAAYHKKYALSFACFVFVLVGAPLGLRSRRGGFGIGASMSLLFFVLYWMLMITGEKVAARGLLDPLISMWAADVVMAGIGIWLIVRESGSVSATSR